MAPMCTLKSMLYITLSTLVMNICFLCKLVSQQWNEYDALPSEITLVNVWRVNMVCYKDKKSLDTISLPL